MIQDPTDVRSGWSSPSSTLPDRRRNTSFSLAKTRQRVDGHGCGVDCVAFGKLEHEYQIPRCFLSSESPFVGQNELDWRIWRMCWIGLDVFALPSPTSAPKRR